MFKGRGEIETAYNAAMNDMSKAIGALPDDVKEKYFENGKKFASIEVITPNYTKHSSLWIKYVSVPRSC